MSRRAHLAPPSSAHRLQTPSLTSNTSARSSTSSMPSSHDSGLGSITVGHSSSPHHDVDGDDDDAQNTPALRRPLAFEAGVGVTPTDKLRALLRQMESEVRAVKPEEQAARLHAPPHLPPAPRSAHVLDKVKEASSDTDNNPPSPPPRIQNPYLYSRRAMEERERREEETPRRLPSRAIALRAAAAAAEANEAREQPKKSSPSALEAFIASHTPIAPIPASEPSSSRRRLDATPLARPPSPSRKGKERAVEEEPSRERRETPPAPSASSRTPSDRLRRLSDSQTPAARPPRLSDSHTPAPRPRLAESYTPMADRSRRRPGKTPRRTSIDLPPDTSASFAAGLEVAPELDVDLDDSDVPWAEDDSSEESVPVDLERGPGARLLAAEEASHERSRELASNSSRDASFSSRLDASKSFATAEGNTPRPRLTNDTSLPTLPDPESSEDEEENLALRRRAEMFKPSPRTTPEPGATSSASLGRSSQRRPLRASASHHDSLRSARSSVRSRNDLTESGATARNEASSRWDDAESRFASRRPQSRVSESPRLLESRGTRRSREDYEQDESEQMSPHETSSRDNLRQAGSQSPQDTRESQRRSRYATPTSEAAQESLSRSRYGTPGSEGESRRSWNSIPPATPAALDSRSPSPDPLHQTFETADYTDVDELGAPEALRSEPPSILRSDISFSPGFDDLVPRRRSNESLDAFEDAPQDTLSPGALYRNARALRQTWRPLNERSLDLAELSASVNPHRSESFSNSNSLDDSPALNDSDTLPEVNHPESTPRQRRRSFSEDTAWAPQATPLARSGVPQGALPPGTTPLRSALKRTAVPRFSTPGSPAVRWSPEVLAENPSEESIELETVEETRESSHTPPSSPPRGQPQRAAQVTPPRAGSQTGSTSPTSTPPSALATAPATPVGPLPQPAQTPRPPGAWSSPAGIPSAQHTPAPAPQQSGLPNGLTPGLSALPTPRPPGSWANSPFGRPNTVPTVLSRLRNEVRMEDSTSSSGSSHSGSDVSFHRLRLSPRKKPSPKPSPGPSPLHGLPNGSSVPAKTESPPSTPTRQIFSTPDSSPTPRRAAAAALADTSFTSDTSELDAPADGDTSWTARLKAAVLSPMRGRKSSSNLIEAQRALDAAAQASAAAKGRVEEAKKAWLAALAKPEPQPQVVVKEVVVTAAKGARWGVWLGWLFLELLLVWGVFQITLDYATSARFLAARDPYSVRRTYSLSHPVPASMQVFQTRGARATSLFDILDMLGLGTVTVAPTWRPPS